MHENPGQRLRHDGENAQRRGEDATLSGLGKCAGAQTQGSARRATLGFVMQSRWDWPIWLG